MPRKQERTIQERVVVDKKVETPISSNTDKQLLKEFLRGEYCIQGVKFYYVLKNFILAK